MFKKIKYKIISSEIFCKHFNKDAYIKIKLMKLVIEHFKKNPNKHIQQLFVDGCKMLSIRQDEVSKVFVFKLILRSNNDLYKLQKELPTPKLVIKDIHGNVKVINRKFELN